MRLSLFDARTDRKRATEYLIASGATAISIKLLGTKSFSITTASKITGTVAAT